MIPALYSASVPVVEHYLAQSTNLIRRAGSADVLLGRLAPDMFSAAEQFATATGFALRATYPLTGGDVPEFPDLGLTAEGLLARNRFANDHLGALEPKEFEGAEDRQITHRAGFAEITQPGPEYLYQFALPNFFFHLSIGFAVLRQNGVEIGKSDFDGIHDYPPGFRF